MTISATLILNEVSKKLQDEGITKRFVHTSILSGLNEAERAVIRAVPNAYSQIVTFSLAEGAQQSAPTGALRIIDFVCNMGTAGSTPGLPLNRVSRRALEAANRVWFSTTANATVLDVAYDPDINLKTFWVSPPQPSSGFGQVKAIVSKYPTEIAAPANNINLSDEYKDALIYYTVGWVLENESEEQDYSKSKLYYDKFASIVSGM